jgi:hypothetical protein
MLAWDGKMAACLTLSLRSTWPASPRAGAIQGRGGGWTGEDLQVNLVRLDPGDRIQPHRNDEVEVLVVVAHLPKGTVRAIEAVDGPLAYLSIHRRRSGGLQVGGHAQRR